MLKVIRSQPHPYAIAFLAWAIALGLTWLLEPLMSPTVFALFYPAVMISALYGGLESGLLSILLAALATKYFFLPPLHSLAFTSANTLFRFTVLLLVALMISLVSIELRAAKQRMEKSLSRLRRSEEQLRAVIEQNLEIAGVFAALGASAGSMLPSGSASAYRATRTCARRCRSGNAAFAWATIPARSRPAPGSARRWWNSTPANMRTPRATPLPTSSAASPTWPRSPPRTGSSPTPATA